jgi:hypothetical protein
MAKRLLDEEIENILEEEDWSSSDEDDDIEFDSDDECDSDEEDDTSDSIDFSPPNPSPNSWTEYALQPPTQFPFSGNAGVQDGDLVKEDVLGIFESFFTEDLITLIVVETNRYAKQYLEKNNLKSKSRCHQWTDTNNAEIKTYFGLLILQGINSKPTESLYFTKRESVETPFFSKIMSQRRFLLISKFLHFANNDEYSSISVDCPNRKLYKIQPIFKHLQNKFKTLYIPEKNISIDESLLGWKGRLGYVQYIPSKRKRFGIKFFELCESQTGYVWNFICYTGASTLYPNVSQDIPVTEKVVLSLAHELLNKGYTLYMDNFYNSVDLTEKLLLNKTDVVGTMRLNRKGIPIELKNKKLKKGEYHAVFRGKVMIIRWVDKKDITLISTKHNDTFNQKIGRGGHVHDKPVAVLDYNKNMGGVDISDNLLHFYTIARNRLKKYYMKMFRHIFDITGVNCYIIYKKLGGKKKRLEFMLELAEAIISKYGFTHNKSNRPSKIPKISRLLERHFPAIIPPTKKSKPTKRCVVCTKSGVRKESRYWCEECGVGLCPAPCFKIYHTNNLL